MILVTGAAGKTGKAVVKALATRGASVRALVRRAAGYADARITCGALIYDVQLGTFELNGVSKPGGLGCSRDPGQYLEDPNAHAGIGDVDA